MSHDETNTNKKKIKRSRNGCHNCKRLKIKCDEKKPICSYCTKTKSTCDYSIVLTWGGRPYKDTNKRRKINSVPKISQNSSIIELKPSSKNNSKTYDNNQIQFIAEEFPTDVIKSPSSPSSLTSPQFVIGNNPKTPRIPRADEEKRVHNQSCQTPSIQSPNTFMTPNGTSILLDTIEPDIPNPPPLTQMNFESFINSTNSVDLNKFTTGSSVSSESIKFPENYSAGMNYLNDAIEKITDGEIEFQLQNSLIIKNYMKNSKKKENSQISTAITDDSDPFLLDYSQDITKIEKYIPRQASNFNGDSSPLRSASSLLNPFNFEPSGYSEVEEVDEIEEIQKTFDYSIPPSLVPLPSLLLNVPFYRDLMQFWVQVACHHLVPAPADIYQNNPFKVLLSQMAMEYPAILCTLLAFSAKCRSSLISSEDTPDIILDQLLSRSCTELLILLKDKSSATSNAALATALLLSVYEVFDSKDFSKHRAHTIGARQILKARSALPLKKEGNETDITFFLMRWFVYIDVIGAFSATKYANNYVLITDETEKYEPIENVTILSSVNDEHKNLDNFPQSKPSIDYLMGFDIRFLSYFAKITMLIRKTNQYVNENNSSSFALPQEHIIKALEVKENLLSLLNQDDEITQADHEHILNLITRKENINSIESPDKLKRLIKKNQILRHTNRMFCFAGIIHLYRRVLLIPRESSLVQELANQIGQIANDNIESQSPTDTCVVSCYFTGGCEALDASTRSFFETRFVKIAEMGNINARKGLEIIRRCWSTGEDWMTVAKELNLDFALL